MPYSNIPHFGLKSKEAEGNHKRLESNGLVRILSGSLMLYFDHNATTPLSSIAREAWMEAIEQYVGNPSSPHR
ncbi:uncharacterized protein METZ01_LOCUS509339, partial [marine metagenome]